MMPFFETTEIQDKIMTGLKEKKKISTKVPVSHATLLSEIMAQPSYSLELKIRKNYSKFLEDLEKKLKREGVKNSYESFKQKNRASFVYTKKGFFFFRPSIQMKVKLKKADHGNSYLRIKGQPLSYGYNKTHKYIDHLLLKLLG